MIGTLITFLIFMWVFALGGGMILAKLTWTPPGQKR